MSTTFLQMQGISLSRKCTGSDNRLILENLRRLDECGIPLELRMPLMTGWNDTEDDLRKAGALLGSLRSAGSGSSVELPRFRQKQIRRFASSVIVIAIIAKTPLGDFYCVIRMTLQLYPFFPLCQERA